MTGRPDPTRRSVVACLAERPRAVGELAAELPTSRPAVSPALKVLKDVGPTIAVDFVGRGIGGVLVPVVVRREARREMPAAPATLKDRLEAVPPG